MEAVQNVYQFWRGCVVMWWQNRYYTWFIAPWGIFGVVTIFVFPDFRQTQFWQDYQWWLLSGTLAISVVPLFVWAPHRLWRGAHQRINALLPLERARQDREEHLKDYIFPYIRQINISAMVRNSADYLNMTVCFPNSAVYPLTLTLTGIVNIGGVGESLRLDTEKVSWQTQANITQLWKVRFDSAALALLKAEVEKHKNLEVSVRLWDINDQDRKYWQTEQTTIRPLE